MGAWLAAIRLLLPTDPTGAMGVARWSPTRCRGAGGSRIVTNGPSSLLLKVHLTQSVYGPFATTPISGDGCQMAQT